jgi:hypothetical protein
VSCDDIPFAQFLMPPLTTVRVPLAETGERAVELLLRAIAGETVPERSSLLPVELIIRESCGGVPRPAPRPGPANVRPGPAREAGHETDETEQERQ